MATDHRLGRSGTLVMSQRSRLIARLPWGSARESYTPRYRQEAAPLVIDTGRTIAQVAGEMGVGEALLGRWVAIKRSRMGDPPEAIDADERADLVRLRRGVAELGWIGSS